MSGPKWRTGDNHYRNKNPDMLEGIPAIAEYLGHSYTTIQRWINHHELPAHKLPNGRWLTTKYAITAWIFQGHKTEIDRRVAMGREVREGKPKNSAEYIEYHREKRRRLTHLGGRPQTFGS